MDSPSSSKELDPVRNLQAQVEHLTAEVATIRDLAHRSREPTGPSWADLESLERRIAELPSGAITREQLDSAISALKEQVIDYVRGMSKANLEGTADIIKEVRAEDAKTVERKLSAVTADAQMARDISRRTIEAAADFLQSMSFTWGHSSDPGAAHHIADAATKGFDRILKTADTQYAAVKYHAPQYDASSPGSILAAMVEQGTVPPIEAQLDQVERQCRALITRELGKIESAIKRGRRFLNVASFLRGTEPLDPHVPAEWAAAAQTLLAAKSEADPGAIAVNPS